MSRSALTPAAGPRGDPRRGGLRRPGLGDDGVRSPRRAARRDARRAAAHADHARPPADLRARAPRVRARLQLHGRGAFGTHGPRSRPRSVDRASRRTSTTWRPTCTRTAGTCPAASCSSPRSARGRCSSSAGGSSAVMTASAVALGAYFAVFMGLAVVGLHQYSSPPLRSKGRPILGLWVFAQAVVFPFLFGWTTAPGRMLETLLAAIDRAASRAWPRRPRRRPGRAGGTWRCGSS